MCTTQNATSVIERITPEMAHQILQDHNHGNRQISDSVVRSYSETMKRGEWLLNGQAICFDYEGRLVDGQHRLKAIERSGCTIEMFVCRGVSPKSFTTYDCGRSRTAGQLIGMSQAPNYNTIAGAIKSVHSLRNGLKFNESGTNNVHAHSGYLTNTQQLDEFENNRSKYIQAGQFAISIRSKFPKTSFGWGYIAGVYYYLVNDKNYNDNVVSYFFRSIFSFSTCENEMLDALRITLQKDMGSNIKYSSEYKHNLLAKYWNLYISGEIKKKIHWDKEKDGYVVFK